MTNDLVTLANRYQNVAATSEPGSQKEENRRYQQRYRYRRPDYREGAGKPHPYRNKARMMLVKHDNQPSAEQRDAYLKVVEILDLDPANKEKRTDMYNEAYSQIASFYISEKDIPMAKTYYEKVLELDPTNEALRDYISKMKVN